MSEFVTKDSGERIEFESGMRRDVDKGKPRFDLLVPDDVPYEQQFLTRVAALMARGAEKYCRPVDIEVQAIKEICSCGNRTAIQVGLITLADSVEAVTRRIFDNAMQSSQSASGPMLVGGQRRIQSEKPQPTLLTLLQVGIDVGNKRATADGPLEVFLLTLVSDYWSRRVDDAPSAVMGSAREALTWIMTTELDWQEGFFVHAATRAWDSSEIRRTVYGEHSPTCSTRRVVTTSTGFQLTNDRNWELASSEAEMRRFKASGFRHFMQWFMGEVDEDHAAATVFNLMCFETLKSRAASEPHEPEIPPFTASPGRVFWSNDISTPPAYLPDGIFEEGLEGWDMLDPHAWPADLEEPLREGLGLSGDDVAMQLDDEYDNCHCGKQVVGDPDLGAPAQALCRDCLPVRCDAYPGSCVSYPSRGLGDVA